MSHHGKINWLRLRNAAKEAALIMLTGIVMVAIVGLPVFLCLVTNIIWFVFLYPLIFFVVTTWENYNGF